MNENQSPNPSKSQLSQRVFSGGKWMLGFRVIDQVLSKSRLIVIANFLTPGDFGMMGVALLFMAIVETFSETGFATALIQRKAVTEAMLNTAWTFRVIRGVLLVLIVAMVAAPVATFFETREAEAVIIAVAICFSLKSFTNIGVIYFQKNLEFNRQFVLQLCGSVADLLVAITLAIIWQNYWALVFALFARQLTEVVVSYILHEFRPRFQFDFQAFRSLLQFGKWILMTNVVTFFAAQGPDLVVTKLLGVHSLGIFQMASRLGNIAATEVAGLFARVTLPAYSALQGDLERLRNAYLSVLTLNIYLVLPITVLLVLLGPDIIFGLLGDTWAEVVVPLQILAIAGGMRAMVGTAAPVFLALGKPRLDLHLNLVRLLVIAVFAIPSAIRYGLVGVCVTLLLSLAVINLMAFSQLQKLGVLDGTVLFKALQGSLVPTLTLTLCIAGINWLLIGYMLHPLINVLVSGTVGGVAFVVVSRWIKPEGWSQVLSIVSRQERTN